MAVLVDGGGFLPLLTLDTVDADTFRAGPPRGPVAHFSRGILGAQGLAAAGRTVDTDWRWVRSVRVEQLGNGAATRPVEYRVECLRDTEELSTRRVCAVQDGEALAMLTVSFRAPHPGRGPAHRPAGADEWPDPHTLPASGPGAAMDVRQVDRAPCAPAGPPGAADRMWVRFTEEIPDRILLHAAALLYAADLLLGQPRSGAGPRADGGDLTACFHRGFRADDWMRHEYASPATADGRAPTTGRFLSSMGRPVASLAQETTPVPAAVPHEGSARDPRKE